uniref:Uncharacterized protein n=1 Tax=Castor canadensis TaxID=51338 RepID=A0A8C0ZP29_CASCN
MEEKSWKKTIDDLGEDIRPEMKEDIHDPSYQDEEGPPPKLEYVWRNIILMGLLHVGALYGLTLVPTCKFYTWLWVYLYSILSGLGITAGAHRLWSHRTYKEPGCPCGSSSSSPTPWHSRTMYMNGLETTVPTTSSQKHTLILTIPVVAFSFLTWVGCWCANTQLSKRRAVCWTCLTSKLRNW